MWSFSGCLYASTYSGVLFRSVGCPTWAHVAVKLTAVVVDVPPGSTALLAGRGSGSPAATAVVFTRSPGDHALTPGDSTNGNHVLLRQMRSTKDPSPFAIHARPPIYAHLSQQSGLLQLPRESLRVGDPAVLFLSYLVRMALRKHAGIFVEISSSSLCSLVLNAFLTCASCRLGAALALG